MHAMLTTGSCLHTFSHLCFLEKTWAEAIRKVAAAFLKSLKLIGDPSETSQRFLCAGAVRERGQTGGESACPSNNSELGKVQRFPGGKMRFLFWNENALIHHVTWEILLASCGGGRRSRRAFLRMMEHGVPVMHNSICCAKGSRGRLLPAARLFPLSRDLFRRQQ